ncbi:MAG: SDR family oxidoreductase [Burkholderiaceae bacterium]|jgi:nucleoside-diphosphate-sugar epimerase|nr:SDR family oxidoreductase [Burkholderiaceae bacterium]
MNTLLDRPRCGKRVLLTGGTGYLGALIAAQILHDGWADYLLIPTRKLIEKSMPDDICNELQALGSIPEDFFSCIQTVQWQNAELTEIQDLYAMIKNFGINSIIHCAGCLDYYNDDALNAINIEFTMRLTVAAKMAGVEFFAYISTAYSAGYAGRMVPETALSEPCADPTSYTRTKRAAEHLIQNYEVPFIVVRPSIVIGDSATGRYSGKRYGLYQQWMGIERLLCDRYHSNLHLVGTDEPVNLLHQDTFQASIAYLLRWIPISAYVNLVSDNASVPSMKALWRLVGEVMLHPRSITFYDNLKQINLKTLDIRQRSYLTFARTNLEIAAYPWQFERQWLPLLQQRGLQFAEASVTTVQTCLDRFVRSSTVMQKYHECFHSEFADHIVYRDSIHNARIPLAANTRGT